MSNLNIGYLIEEGFIKEAVGRFLVAVKEGKDDNLARNARMLEEALDSEQSGDRRPFKNSY